jgi:hypothetical protein
MSVWGQRPSDWPAEAGYDNAPGLKAGGIVVSVWC